MGIAVMWDTELKEIICQNYELEWDWDEYQAAFAKTCQLAHEVEYPIGLIAEVADMKHIPPGAIIHGARAIFSLPSNIVLSVVITRSGLAKSILNLILRATQFKNVIYATNRDEARIYIRTKLDRLYTEV